MTNEVMNRNDLMRNFFNNDNWMNFPAIFEDNFMTDSALKTDIKENDHDYQVTVEVPGLDKKDINVRYDNDVLTISGKKDSFSDEADKDGNTLMSERNYGSFTRQYRLPRVNAAGIKGKYENGVLAITLPKEKKDVPSDHRIDIQ